MKILRNPIVLAIIVGAVVFVLMSYCYKTTDTKTKDGTNNKKKKKNNKSSSSKETIIISAVIASLVTWYLASTYLCDSVVGNDATIAELDLGANENPQVQKSANGQLGGKIPSLSSENNTSRSYNLLGSGLNIPKTELPKVLIDYN
ncbi:MAG: hypothetical protein Dasosvirus2_26 [Dasosvirus sp.]|uniref:Uncharacterized protein n=1 Tax=Dasosvirus sp. TaxID=2487764 RepID=A0A3G4ZR91_9VIRU|nr:MAG: hypothetical protein Dasosvirus2_26 [Dasosvirus sp.]